MPKGIPVATVAINGADNAGILAAQILGVSEEKITEKLDKMKSKMVKDLAETDQRLQTEMWWKM